MDQRQMRALRYAAGGRAGGRYFDFTPVLIMARASVIGARALVAIGAGDTELYLFAGMRAAVIISIRVFLVQGTGPWWPSGSNCGATPCAGC